MIDSPAPRRQLVLFAPENWPTQDLMIEKTLEHNKPSDWDILSVSTDQQLQTVINSHSTVVLVPLPHSYDALTRMRGRYRHQLLELTERRSRTVAIVPYGYDPRNALDLLEGTGVDAAYCISRFDDSAWPWKHLKNLPSSEPTSSCWQGSALQDSSLADRQLVVSVHDKFSAIPDVAREVWRRFSSNDAHFCACESWYELPKACDSLRDVIRSALVLLSVCEPYAKQKLPLATLSQTRVKELERDIEDVRDVLDVWKKKKKSLELGEAVAADPEQKFNLSQQIRSVAERVEEYDKQLKELQRQLHEEMQSVRSRHDLSSIYNPPNLDSALGHAVAAFLSDKSQPTLCVTSEDDQPSRWDLGWPDFAYYAFSTEVDLALHLYQWLANHLEPEAP